MFCRSTTPEPTSGAIGSGGASASAAANVDQWSAPAKFGKDKDDVAVGGDFPQCDVGEIAAAGAVGSDREDEDKRPVTADVLDFTGAGLEDSILADKEDLKKLDHACQTCVDTLFVSVTTLCIA